MAEELKACPFCGGKAETVQFTKKRWTVECFADGCGAGIISQGDMQTAIAAWNNRAQLPSQGGEAVEVVATVRAKGFGRVFEAASADAAYLHCSEGDQLMTVAQHQRILAASVGSGDPVAWRVTGRDGLTVTAQYPEWAESDCLLTITPLYTHPADQVAEDLRDLLERALPYLNNTPDLVQFGAEELAGEIRALLANSEGVSNAHMPKPD